MDNARPSIVYMRFISDDGANIDYIDFRGNCSSDYYDELIPLSDKIPFSTVENKLKQADVVKYWSISNKKEIATIFSDNLLTYFPSYGWV